MDYKIYTDEYDEVIRPLDLSTETELHALAEDFHKLCPVEDFEPLRERLALLKAPEESTIVSLLIDNSGSMRGYPITFAIGAVGIIGMYLDRLGIPNEILGFTTKAWKGGDAREKWLWNGRPQEPGRLNVLRHIVYKEVNEKLEDVRHYLALMMREGLLKENIDGEAVEWACTRLREHDAERRILLVISDGAPIDDSTLEQMDKEAYDSANARNENSYLSKHLKQVIRDLNFAGDIQLDAIGIKHDVSAFYGVGDTVQKLEDLAPIAIAKLEKLLEKPMREVTRTEDEVFRQALLNSVSVVKMLPSPKE